MNALTSDAKVAWLCFPLKRVLPITVVIAAVAAMLGATEPVSADDMLPGATLEPRPPCNLGGCPEMRGQVYFGLQSVVPGDPASDVIVTPFYTLSDTCGSVLATLTLYVVEELEPRDPCVWKDPQPDPFPIDLTAGQFTLTWQQKSMLLDGESCAVSAVTQNPEAYDLVEEIVGLVEKQLAKIPTLSGWGLIVMTGLLLTTATIVLARRRGQAA